MIPFFLNSHNTLFPWFIFYILYYTNWILYIDCFVINFVDYKNKCMFLQVVSTLDLSMRSSCNVTIIYMSVFFILSSLVFSMRKQPANFFCISSRHDVLLFPIVLLYNSDNDHYTHFSHISSIFFNACSSHIQVCI